MSWTVTATDKLLSYSGAYPATWNNPALKTVFDQTPPPPVKITAPTNAPNTIVPSPSSSSNHLNIIIGVVVAIVVASLVSLGLCLCLLRRKYKRRQQQRRIAISSPIGQPELISELSNTTRHHMSAAISHLTLERKIMEEISRWNTPPPPRYCIEMDGGELDGGEVAREMNDPRTPKDVDPKHVHGPSPVPPPKMKVRIENHALPPHPLHPKNQPRKQFSRKRSSPILSPLDEEKSEEGEKRSLRSDVSPVEGRRAESRKQKTSSPELISPV